MLPSWPTFSSRVIADISKSARSSWVSAGFSQGRFETFFSFRVIVGLSMSWSGRREPRAMRVIVIKKRPEINRALY
jgi:hypothetical protein